MVKYFFLPSLASDSPAIYVFAIDIMKLIIRNERRE